jgi:hypothetical protein
MQEFINKDNKLLLQIETTNNNLEVPDPNPNHLSVEDNKPMSHQHKETTTVTPEEEAQIEEHQ